MYQLEVKRWLVEHRFHPREGWDVTVDVDAMERARGGQHPEDKKALVQVAETALIELGATIGAHPMFGRADVVAEHPEKGVYLVEVEGTSSRQSEQAMYSALGQSVLLMRGGAEKYMLAVPDEPKWERQVGKIPGFALEQLGLQCVLVSEGGIRDPVSV